LNRAARYRVNPILTVGTPQTSTARPGRVEQLHN
jgi:hypothetical protein